MKHVLASHCNFTSTLVLVLTLQLVFLIAFSASGALAQARRLDDFDANMLRQRPVPSSKAQASGLEAASSDTADVTAAHTEAASRWQALSGPETGLGASLLVNGSRIFVGTTGGIFVSDDGGRNWQRSQRSPGQFVSGLVRSGNILLYGTDPFEGRGGVVRSTDNGNSWQIVQTGFPGGTRVVSLAVKGNTIFAATARGQVFRSADQGISWQLASNGLTPVPGRRHQLAASDFGLVIQLNQTLYRSADSNNWTALNLHLPAGISASAPAAIRHILLLATNGAGVYLSDDGGNYWYAPNHGLPVNAVITNLHTDNDTVYCTTADGTLYTSSDLGKTWIPKDAGFGIGKTLLGSRSIGRSGNVLLAVTWDGIYRSVNQGYTWQRSNRGLRAGEITTRIVAQGRRIYVPAQGGVWVSEDRGHRWTLLNNGMNPVAPSSQGAGGIAVVGRTLFAGMDGDGIYRSDNHGRRWEPANEGLPEGFWPFVIKAIGGKIYLGSIDSGAAVSSDGGASWQVIKDFPADAAFFDFAPVGNAILAASYGTGVYRSTDNGNSWQPFNNGMGSDFINDFLVTRQQVLAATDDGLFRLRADGTGWEEIRSYTEAAGGSNGLASAGGVIYSTTFGAGIWASSDQGTTWRPMNDGIPTNRAFYLSVIGRDLYVGTSGNGVFVLRGARSEHEAWEE